MCSVSGCNGDIHNKTYELCYKHYMRFYRYGSTDLQRKPAKPYSHSHGYLMVPAAGHPMARGSSHAYEHRVKYYDKHGAGPFACHWCSKDVTWEDLHIDHLNENKKDNRIENLVASCSVCNFARGHYKQKKKMRAKGRMLSYGGETLCVSEWAERIGISAQSMQWRIRNGWSTEDAVTKPRGKTGPR